MSDKDLIFNKNQMVNFLHKAQREFTREDIISYISANDIEMVNFMYPAADGRLKTLNFVINDLAYLETILTLGERVDGSSLFPFIRPRRATYMCSPASRPPLSTPLPRFPQ